MKTITLKFGGSALANAETFEKACQIILNNARQGSCHVVVSALKGSTEKLIQICASAAVNPASCNETTGRTA